MENIKWVAGWGASISYTAQNHADYIKDQTFRYVIFPTMNARALRLHFSNLYGTESVTVDKVYLAQRTTGEFVDPATNAAVTFGGRCSVTLPAGGSVVSDEPPFAVEAGREFCVSMYFTGPTQLTTGHSNNGPYIKKYFGKGDWADKACVPLEEYGEGGPYVFLHTIDFQTSDDCAAIVAFGDSITAQPWPDCLARKIHSLGLTNRAIIRKGIGGSRVLLEYGYRIKRHWGEAGIKRFERDILQAGADRVFVLHGINDLIHPGSSRYSPMSELPGADELIGQGYKKYIEIARRHGMKIYLATLLPCPRCLAGDGVREETRCRVNEWIRTTDLIDGVIDFERAVMDPNDPKRIAPEYDSGDQLHPSLAGAARMADSVPLEFVVG
jgi:lysophospholipase L1-like esterase